MLRPDAMTPAHRPAVYSPTVQKVHLEHKLSLLVKGRDALEQELRNLTQRVTADDVVQSLAEIFKLSKALDEKRKAISNVSALLKDTRVDAMALPPVIFPREEIKAERPPISLPAQPPPPIRTSNPKSVKITPLFIWGRGDGVQLQHPKQTADGLLHFLRLKFINGGLPDATAMELNSKMYLPQSESLPVKTQGHQLRPDENSDLSYEEAAGTLNQSPIFKIIKETESSVTYSWMIATETELWDYGEIMVENTLSPKPEHEGGFASAKTPLSSTITIPEFQIGQCEEIEVVVSHIVSPGDFYVQRKDTYGKLRALIMESLEPSSSYAEQDRIPNIGTLVIGWFSKQEQWCRAQVTKICGVSAEKNVIYRGKRVMKMEVEVKRLDHGDTVCLPLWCIKELTPEMAALPLQAVQVSVANVVPINGSGWSELAVSWFKVAVHNKTFYARLYPQGPEVKVELFFQKGRLGAMRRCASISVGLEQNGHAKQITPRNGGFRET